MVVQRLARDKTSGEDGLAVGSKLSGVTMSKPSTYPVGRCGNTHSFIHSLRISGNHRSSGMTSHVMQFLIEILRPQESRHGFVSGVVGRAAYAVCRCVQSIGFQRYFSKIMTVSTNNHQTLGCNALLKLIVLGYRVSVAQPKYRCMVDV